MSQPAPLYDKPRVTGDGTVEFPESWKKYFQVLDALVKALESSVDTLEDPTTQVNVHTHADSTEGGPLYLRHYSITADATLGTEHNGAVIEISGTFDLTLPALSDMPDGYHFYLKHITGGTVTIYASDSNTVDGVSGPWPSTITNVSLLLSKGQSDSDWRVVLRNYMAGAVSNPSVSTPLISSSSASSAGYTSTDASPFGFSSSSDFDGFQDKLNALVTLANELKSDFNTLSNDVDTLDSKIEEIIANMKAASLMAS